MKTINKPEEDGEVEKGTEEEKEPQKKVKKRETWSRKIDFLLACIGFSVGLGNVWRFPYLCYKNGGGAFLIPYFICVIVGGIPLFYLEVAIGQFMGVSGWNAWKICPLFQGIGITSLIIVIFLNIYYNVIICWSFYYVFASFTLELPWVRCGHEWNTVECRDIYWKPENSTMANFTLFNSSLSNSTNMTEAKKYIPDPVTEFWERKVLSISDGIENMGIVKWDLALCLLLSWIVVYICICKGIKSSGKVMYVTATSPYIFMICLLIRGATLDGAKEGVLFYLRPNISRLSDIEVWVDAGTQIFFSYSISLGALTALGSYNLFNHNSYRDAIIFACTNSGTSILAGLIIFPVLGSMAIERGVDIKDVAESGPGLAFIAYPKAVSNMPAAPVWSVLFFVMVILLGLDSEFVGVEAVITFIVDQYPNVLRRGYRREILIAVVCFLSYLIGLSMCSKGGMYVFQLFDYYSGSRILLLVAFFECIAIAWIYGVNRFYDNIEMMLGWRINPFMKICWLVFSPLFCMIIFVMSCINYSELSYKRPSSTYTYPGWAVGVGWGTAALSAIWIPIIAIWKLFKKANCLMALKTLIKPSGLKRHQQRPQDYEGNGTSMYELNGDGAIKSVQGIEANKINFYVDNPAFKI